MNCAFAIGRICDHENGRIAVLKFGNTKKLIEVLCTMIEQNLDNGCTKNACYALSTLASTQQAHQIIVEHTSFNNLLNILCKLLTSVSDSETQWFAAMLLRIFCSFPSGCSKMKTMTIITQTLNELMQNEDLYIDVREEITTILDTLKPLDKPEPIKAEVKGPTEIVCEWSAYSVKNKITIRYLLFKDGECIYSGPNTSFKLSNLTPFTQYTFTLQVLGVENNEKSQASDPVLVQTEETLPTEPQNLKIVGTTTSIIKIAWDPPENMNGLFKGYFIYNGENLLDQTNELNYMLGGLSPATSYELFVCASTTKGKGEKASIRGSTCSLGDIMPDKPTFGLIGRREILIRWQPPQVITGKLNRYDLHMNGKCIYSGVALDYQVSMLKPDTEYKFEVICFC